MRALWVGRFQPFHLGHRDMAHRILREADELVVAVGSAQYSHTPENPFTAGERLEMIARALRADGLDRWTAVPVTDTGVHAVWVAHVASLVPPFEVVYANSALVRRLFEERRHKVLELPLLRREEYSGQEVRRRMRAGEDWASLVPPPVGEYLEEIRGAERVRQIGDVRGGIG